MPVDMTDDSATRERIFAALTGSATHPGVTRIDTHAASVFLEGTRALKINGRACGACSRAPMPVRMAFQRSAFFWVTDRNGAPEAEIVEATLVAASLRAGGADADPAAGDLVEGAPQLVRDTVDALLGVRLT